MAQMYVIKAKNSAFRGQRLVKNGDTRLNAGSLTLLFHDGVSHPVTKDHAELFVQHFPQYKMEPVSEETEEASDSTELAQQAVQFLKDHKIGKADFKAGDNAQFKLSYATRLAEKGIVELINTES